MNLYLVLHWNMQYYPISSFVLAPEQSGLDQSGSSWELTQFKKKEAK